MVIGAGAAGLAAALAFQNAGVEVVVLEADAHAGGKLQTIRDQGYLIERAAIGLLDREGDLRPLADRLGLPLLPARKSARHRWVTRDGEVHRLPAGPLSFGLSGLFSGSEKRRLLREPWVAGKTSAEPESVRGFFERRLGPAGAFLAEAIQTGIYAGDADRLDVQACFPSLVAAEARAGSVVRGMLRRPKPAPADGGPIVARPRRARLTSFAAGLEALPLAMAAALGPRVRLSTRVVALGQGSTQWIVRAAGPTGMTDLQADAIVLAVPAPQAAALLGPLDTGLADLLRTLAAAPITTVHFGVRRADVAHRLNGFGLLSPGRPVIGTLFPSSLWEGRAPEGSALLSSLVGGARSPAAAALPDADLVALVREELSRTVGLPAAAPAELTRIVRWPQAVPQYEVGHLATVASLEERAAAFPRLALTGAWYRGVSVLDCLRDGRRQAERLIASLRPPAT